MIDAARCARAPLPRHDDAMAWRADLCLGDDQHILPPFAFDYTTCALMNVEKTSTNKVFEGELIKYKFKVRSLLNLDRVQMFTLWPHSLMHSEDLMHSSTSSYLQKPLTRRCLFFSISQG
jgi:hypothetical protein